MTGCTHDGNTIPVMAPKDAEGSLVSLDTKVLYNASGDEFEVRWLTFSTGPYGPGWSVKVYDPSDGDTSDDRGNTLPLDFMYLENPDSLKQLAEDLNRMQEDYVSNGNNYQNTPCAYAGGKERSCKHCKLDHDNKCFENMIRDIVGRVNRLAGDSE